MRRIDLDSQQQHLIISFPYHPSLVEVVRGLPERRFDRATRTWSVPSEHAAAVVEALESHGFLRSPEVETLVEGRAPEPTPAVGTDSGDPGPNTLRISELNLQVRRAVVSAFPEPVWVVGEIAGYDRNQQRRHAFFELVEKSEGAETPRARVRAVLFESARSRVDRACQDAPEPFSLADGIEVRFRVRIDVYEATGSYQVIVEDVDPVHTLGRLALARRELLRELTERGLRDRNRSQPLASLPLRVALITSWGSDAFNDVVKELEQSGFAFSLTVFDARMQGQALKETIAAGLDHFARTAADHDVLLVARGGGARSDLVWFDDRDLAYRVAEHPLKIVCGIGHQRDESVLDCLTTSVKTPTAAAQLLVAAVTRAESELQDRLEQIARVASRVVLVEGEHWRQRGGRLIAAVDARLRTDRREVEHQAARLGRAGRGAFRSAGNALTGRAHRLPVAVRMATRTGRERVRAALARLEPSRLSRLVSRADQRLEACEKRLRALDPRRVLERGFAVVHDGRGRVVTGTSGVRAGDRVVVRLVDGRFQAEVDQVNQDSRDEENR